MLTSVEVRTPFGDALVLPYQDATEGYIVKDIQGLDPVKATVTSSPFALLDGSQFQNSRAEARNILIKLGLEPTFMTPSIRALRKELYKYFMPKQTVQLTFISDDEANVTTMGHIESMEAPLFTKDPETVISVLCFDPAFYATESTSISTTSGAGEVEIIYPGSVDAGYVFQLTCAFAPITGFTISHRLPDDSTRTLQFSVSLLVGDVVTISTIPGNKRAILTRSGADSSVIYGVTPSSDYPVLKPGANYIRVTADVTNQPFTVEFVSKHGGL